MKNISYLFILLLSLVITTTSCDDEPLEGQFFSTGDGSDPIDDTDNQQNADGEITANIDGDGFEASGEFAFGAFTAGVFNITGITAEQALTITISGVDGPGSFDIGFDSLGGAAINITNPTETFLSNTINGSGTVTIETLDMTNLVASGTFDFIAVGNTTGDIIEVTNGTFNVSLTQDVPDGNSENIFLATVGGELYEPDSIQGQLLTTNGLSFITINTNDNTTGENMSLTLPSDITPGEYTFDTFPGTDSIIGQYISNINDPNAESFSSTSSGSMLTIIAHDTTNNIIEGTFSFSALPFVNTNNLDPIEITEGSFFVVY